MDAAAAVRLPQEEIATDGIFRTRTSECPKFGLGPPPVRVMSTRPRSPRAMIAEKSLRLIKLPIVWAGRPLLAAGAEVILCTANRGAQKKSAKAGGRSSGGNGSCAAGVGQ